MWEVVNNRNRDFKISEVNSHQLGGFIWGVLWLKCVLWTFVLNWGCAAAARSRCPWSWTQKASRTEPLRTQAAGGRTKPDPRNRNSSVPVKRTSTRTRTWRPEEEREGWRGVSYPSAAEQQVPVLLDLSLSWFSEDKNRKKAHRNRSCLFIRRGVRLLLADPWGTVPANIWEPKNNNNYYYRA